MFITNSLIIGVSICQLTGQSCSFLDLKYVLFSLQLVSCKALNYSSFYGSLLKMAGRVIVKNVFRTLITSLSTDSHV